MALTVAELPGEGGAPPARFLLLNTQQFLFICSPQTLDRASLRHCLAETCWIGCSCMAPVLAPAAHRPPVAARLGQPHAARRDAPSPAPLAPAPDVLPALPPPFHTTHRSRCVWWTSAPWGLAPPAPSSPPATHSRPAALTVLTWRWGSPRGKVGAACPGCPACVHLPPVPHRQLWCWACLLCRGQPEGGAMAGSWAR